MDLLRRTAFSCALAALVSCGGAPALTEPPKLIHGGWIRNTMTEAGPDAMPENLRALHAVKIWNVTYKGPQDISGVWALYPSETVAFEAIQRVNKHRGIRPFHRGAFFAILNAEGLPAQALGDFQEGVNKAIH